MKVKAPRNFKNRLGQRRLVSQDDFYTEATEYEEQAERWMLSDIKKALRFYVQALDTYEDALTAPDSTVHGTYNILYNMTRLFLQIHTDYLANNGYINVLQYVRLDDIPGVSKLALPLPDIVQRFERVYEQFPNERTWDLDSNLLTCYLSLLESIDNYNLSGEQVVNLTVKFVELGQGSIEYQFSELRNWNAENIGEEEDDDSFVRDSIDDSSNISSKDGSGITRDSRQPTQMTESMEVADQITADTLSELLVNSLKFIQSLVEIIIEVRTGTGTYISLNPVQLNYLEDIVKRFSCQVEDMCQTISSALLIDRKEIDIAIEANRAVGFMANGDLNSVESYVNKTLKDTGESTELLLSTVDVLTFAVTCTDGKDDIHVRWQMCTLLNKVLTKARAKLAETKDAITSGKIHSMNAQLSPIAFQQSDILISSSDNELRRWTIKKEQADFNEHELHSCAKTMEILMKNARTFLINASRIAERACGLEESIVDKLKRNYIYNQAQARLSILENHGKIVNEVDLSELLADHPYYKQFGCES